MKVIFIRHADPDYSIDSLTEEGWKEARALAGYMKTWYEKQDPADVSFYISPLGRAQDTAKETLKVIGREGITYPWLREFDAKIKDPREDKNHIAWDLFPADWASDPLLYDPEHWMESPLMASADLKEKFEAVTKGLDEILKEHGVVRDGKIYRVTKPSHKTVVIFSHMGVSSVMISHLMNCAPSIIWQSTYLSPSSRTVLATEERDNGIASFRMTTMGDTTHLYMNGLEASGSGLFGEVYPEPKNRLGSVID